MRFVVILAGAALLFGGMYILITPIEHEASALLRISRQPLTVLEGRHSSPTTPEDFASFKRTQAQLLRSSLVVNRTVGEKAISKLPVLAGQKDPDSWLLEHTTVDFPEDAEIMRVTVRCTNSDDAIALTNMLVKKYLSEIVQRERDIKLEQERTLEKHVADYNRTAEAELKTLHDMEKAYRVASTAGAELRKRLALEELSGWITQRNHLRQLLTDNTLQTMLAEDRLSLPESSRPATAEEPNVALLRKQKEHIQALLSQADENLGKQAQELQEMDSFNAAVASKQEQWRATQEIAGQLRRELDRVRVEKIAPERIMKLDDAHLVSDRGAKIRRGVAGGGSIALGLLVCGLGLIRGRRRG
jgi:hypothetical protein